MSGMLQGRLRGVGGPWGVMARAGLFGQRYWPLGWVRLRCGAVLGIVRP